MCVRADMAKLQPRSHRTGGGATRDPRPVRGGSRPPLSRTPRSSSHSLTHPRRSSPLPTLCSPRSGGDGRLALALVRAHSPLPLDPRAARFSFSPSSAPDANLRRPFLPTRSTSAPPAPDRDDAAQGAPRPACACAAGPAEQRARKAFVHSQGQATQTRTDPCRSGRGRRCERGRAVVARAAGALATLECEGARTRGVRRDEPDGRLARAVVQLARPRLWRGRAVPAAFDFARRSIEQWQITGIRARDEDRRVVPGRWRLEARVVVGGGLVRRGRGRRRAVLRAFVAPPTPTCSLPFLEKARPRTTFVPARADGILASAGPTGDDGRAGEEGPQRRSSCGRRLARVLLGRDRSCCSCPPPFWPFERDGKD